MSLIDKLLSLDSNDICNLETKKVEIKRLSQKLGEPYEIVIKPISHEDYRRAQQRSKIIKKKGKFDMDLGLFNSSVLLGGIVEPDLTNKELLNHFGCYSSSELADKLFTVGEQATIVEEILILSGISEGEDDNDEDISETIKKQ